LPPVNQLNINKYEKNSINVINCRNGNIIACGPSAKEKEAKAKQQQILLLR